MYTFGGFLRAAQVPIWKFSVRLAYDLVARTHICPLMMLGTSRAISSNGWGSTRAMLVGGPCAGNWIHIGHMHELLYLWGPWGPLWCLLVKSCSYSVPCLCSILTGCVIRGFRETQEIGPRAFKYGVWNFMVISYKLGPVERVRWLPGPSLGTGSFLVDWGGERTILYHTIDAQFYSHACSKPGLTHHISSSRTVDTG